MKYTLVTLALVAVAGSASAQTTRPPLSATVTPSGGAPTTPGATTLQRPEGSGGVMLPSTGAAGSGSPGVNLPSTNNPDGNPRATMAPNAVRAPNTANTPIPPNAPGSNGAARRIQADGYKNVQGLTRGSDGKWHGTAMRGSTMVAVQVDARGNVSSE